MSLISSCYQYRSWSVLRRYCFESKDFGAQTFIRPLRNVSEIIIAHLAPSERRAHNIVRYPRTTETFLTTRRCTYVIKSNTRLKSVRPFVTGAKINRKQLLFRTGNVALIEKTNIYHVISNSVYSRELYTIIVVGFVLCQQVVSNVLLVFFLTLFVDLLFFSFFSDMFWKRKEPSSSSSKWKTCFFSYFSLSVSSIFFFSLF